MELDLKAEREKEIGIAVIHSNTLIVNDITLCSCLVLSCYLSG